jgi:hypothetical protein
MPIKTRVAISQASLWAAPEEIGEAATGDDQRAKGEGVRVDDPLSRGDVGLEVLLDLRDRDIDRREVVGDHEDRDPHRDQGQPGTAVDRPSASLHAGEP